MKSNASIVRLSLVGLAFALAPTLVAASSLFQAAPAEPIVVSEESAEAKAALACLDAYLAAFNSRDDAAYDSTFNYPTYRLAAGQFSTQQPGEVKFSEFLARNPGWDYSRWAKREVIQAGPDKVHIVATLARFRNDGSLVKTFESLYVITKQDGHWGIKIRSSYAPS